MIGIICFNSLRYAQYLYKYSLYFDQNNISYEVLFWNREGEKNELPYNWLNYNEEINSFVPFYKKIFKFIKYVLFLRKKIKERKYNKIIVLTTQTAVPLFTLLLSKYSKKYIYDYRDITYERFLLYRFIVNKIIDNSYFTAISSSGFKQVLKNKSKLIIAHNTRDFEPIKDNPKEKKSPRIRVVYWGMVRQLSFNFTICDLFGRDERFELIYHGAGYHKELFEYCISNGYSNISITGAYNLKEIDSFINHTDIILNAYENDHVQKMATTVKFYDSLRFKIPMIVTSNSHMAKIVTEFNLGFSINWSDVKCLNNLYNSFKSFNWDSYIKNLSVISNEIIRDDKNFYEKLNDFCAD